MWIALTELKRLTCCGLVGLGLALGLNAADGPARPAAFGRAHATMSGDGTSSADARTDTRSLLSAYVRRFNEKDDERYKNAIPNSAAEAFLLKNAPRFACPDKDIERTYYFRWWTFRKHLRNNLGFWTVTEFLPKVYWSGKDNTIVGPAGHHLREGRWLRDPKFMRDDATFWLSDKDATHRWLYSSWLFTGTRQIAEVSGEDDLPARLLDDAVAYYDRWEKGVDRHGARMGGDGRGGFLSLDACEGSECSLGGDGYKPLFACAMWSEAKSIAAVARSCGRTALSEAFEAKAETNRLSILARCWNEDLAFFVTTPTNGVLGKVRELHGYAPWYFGVPTDKVPDWLQLMDPNGFAARYGLTFPERRAPGFVLDYKGHECKWNGPSWPFATSIALTAFANDLQDSSERAANPLMLTSFGLLMRQYAAQHVLRRVDAKTGEESAVPWIDENLNPDTGEWLARRIILDTPSMVKAFARERGKDYNHSTFCDLVISGLVGFRPNGAKGFEVKPLCPRSWPFFTLENLRYRGHDVSIRWRSGSGLLAEVDGKVVARRADLGSLEVRLEED